MRKLFPLWLLLIAASLLSISVVHSRFDFAAAANLDGLLVLSIGALKARYVILDMMDVRAAPIALRVVMESWVLATWGLLCLCHALI